MRRFLVPLLLAIGVLCWAIAVKSSAPVAPLPEFLKPIAAMQSQTKVPLRVPTYIPKQALVADSETGKPQPYIAVRINESGQFSEINAFVIQMQRDSYSISLDAAKDCRGATACSFGSFTGKEIKSVISFRAELPYLDDPNFSPVYKSSEEPSEVTLTNNIKGYFIPYICTASCSESLVLWDENGFRYSVGIRYASKQTMVRMANSAIANQSFNGGER